MFKKIFITLCNKKGVSPSAACKSVGITPATFSGWTDDSIPRKATLMRIADFFEVSVDYLLGKEEAKAFFRSGGKPEAVPESKAQVFKSSADLIEEGTVIYRHRGELREKQLSPSQMDAIVPMLDALPDKNGEI